MTKKIKLYGTLRKLCGVKEFKADVFTVDQVFSFIKVNFPNTKQHLTNACYSVVVNERDITFANILIQTDEDIKVVPLISGNFIFGLGGLIAGFFTSSVVTSALTMLAVNVGLGFLSDLLAPTPSAPEADPQVSSFLSNQNANTTKAGGAAPLIFGECLVGSIVISAGADTVQVNDIPEPDVP
tara:strand:+ start:210 stop:758 length:549 start_codon:yes stop_codon:yes gene_type:complete